MKRVLLLKSGDAAPPLKLAAGDYDRWFAESLAGAATFHVVQAHLGERLPDPRGYDAVMMTGSPQSVTEPSKWMRRAGDYLVEAAERGVNVLGVCFGHQLIAFALGARVVQNPKGREIGTVEVDVTPEGRADPLFAGLPHRLTVQATHEDAVESLPDKAVLLAQNAFGIQAFVAGRFLRGVQFHPEAQPSTMISLIRSRAERLEAEGKRRGEPDRVRTLMAGVRPTPHGRQLLLNFLERCAGN